MFLFLNRLYLFLCRTHVNNDTWYLDQRLNELGEEGWELVTAATDNSMDDDGDTYTESIYYTLKREMEETTDL